MADGPEVFVPVAWSPDGLELAFLAADGDEESVFNERWLFGPTSAPNDPPSSPARSPRAQLWVYLVASREMALIAASDEYLSNPAYAPDGMSMAYVVFEPDANAAHRTESVPGALRLVRQFRDGSKKVLLTESRAFDRARLAGLRVDRPDWSPDGLMLAFPWSSGGLRILDVAANRPVAEIDSATLPSWSSDSRLFAAVRTADPKGVVVFDRGNWNLPRHVAIEGPIDQPPEWETNAPEILIMRQSGGTDRIFRQARRQKLIQLAWLPVDAHGGERIAEQFTLDDDELESFEGGWSAFDRRNDRFEVSLRCPRGTTSFRQVGSESVEAKSWHPFDDPSGSAINVGGQSFDRLGSNLAFRFGSLDWAAPVGICGLDRDSALVLAPTLAAKARAISALAGATKRIVQRVPRNELNPLAQFRPRLELAAQAGEVSWLLDLFDRPKVQAARPARDRDVIAKLASHARGILNDSKAGAMGGTARKRFAEAELFFLYVAENYAEALAASNRLEGLFDHQTSDAERIAINVVQSQCLLGLGRRELVIDRVNKLLARHRARPSPPMDVNERTDLILYGSDAQPNGGGPSPPRDPLEERLQTLLDEASVPAP